MLKFILNYKSNAWTSLVVQWETIPLPMQGTWIQSLTQEDPICPEATQPIAPAPEPVP